MRADPSEESGALARGRGLPTAGAVADGPRSSVGSGGLLDLSAPELADRLQASGARLLVIGRTRDGRAFRPSDWAERLAGVLAQYRPAGPARARAQPHLAYSPLAVPADREGRKCVVVDPSLREVEPLAWAFVLNFARDNGLDTAIC